GVGSATGTSSPPRRASCAACSTSTDEVPSWTTTDFSELRSRRRVSALRCPVTRSASRRRSDEKIISATSSSSTGMAMTNTVMCALPLELEEDAVLPREHEVEAGSGEERADDDEDCPEHHEDREERDRELPGLGLVGRIAIDVRRQDQGEEPDARDGHAGHHRVEHREQLLEAQEVPRRLG